MRTRPTRTRSSFREEHGQAIVLFAVMVVVLLATVGLAVDVGRVLATRTDMQKTADAAALAGAQELPLTNKAQSVAHDYIHKNAAWDTSHTFTFSQTFSANDTITVEARRRVDYTFLRVLGLGGSTVKATATVRKNGYSGGYGIVPWGFIASNDPTSTLLQNACYDGPGPSGVPTFKKGIDCVMKYGAGTNARGDFAALALDGPGGDIYRDSVTYGSKKLYRTQQLINPQTGNMQGPTNQAVNDRLARPAPSGCAGNEITDVLRTNADGSHSVRPGCEQSGRLLIIPVVNQISNPDSSRIIGFAFMFLKGYANQGGQTQVVGQFVSFVTELPNSYYDEAYSDATAVKLLQ